MNLSEALQGNAWRLRSFYQYPVTNCCWTNKFEKNGISLSAPSGCVKLSLVHVPVHRKVSSGQTYFPAIFLIPFMAHKSNLKLETQRIIAASKVSHLSLWFCSIPASFYFFFLHQRKTLTLSLCFFIVHERKARNGDTEGYYWPFKRRSFDFSSSLVLSLPVRKLNIVSPPADLWKWERARHRLKCVLKVCQWFGGSEKVAFHQTVI